MTPEVRYTTSHDGWRIAYSVSGSGPPVFLVTDFAVSHLTLNWGSRSIREQYDRLARGRTLIRSDPRGSGLSQRGISCLERDDLVADIQAVLDAAGFDTCDLVAAGSGTNYGAIPFAVRNPSRVRRLVSVNPRVHEPPQNPLSRALQQLQSDDFESFKETVLQVSWGLNATEASQTAALYRQSLTREDWEIRLRGVRSIDLADVLPEVRVPTLVLSLKRPLERAFAVTDGPEAVAAAIRGARLVVAASARPFNLFPGNLDFLEIICNFLDEGLPETTSTLITNSSLSDREHEVLALIAAGRSNAEIAAALVVAESTVARHVHNILVKLDVSNRAEAAAWWVKRAHR
ncbi:MAG: alpha/beta fold hydrolase [Dehalococcoidia bacterium]